MTTGRLRAWRTVIPICTQPRKVLITGGSRGIGRACVERFRLAGDKVCFVYRSHEREARETETATGAVGLRADLSDRAETLRVIRQAAELLGGLDVLVLNAGIAQKIGVIQDTTDDEWNRLTEVNLSSPFIMCREAVPYFLNRGGVILLTGSVWGRLGGSCEVAYSSLKAGLRGMTLALSRELGPSGIRVNCVEPGVIDTDMNGNLSDDAVRELIEMTPLGRLGTPADVAETMFFLASDGASFITGQVIGVDGGFPTA